jgi:hypothetical protein
MAQLEKLGCFSAGDCIGKILNAVYVQRYAEDYCAGRLGFGGKYDGDGKCVCDAGLVMDKGRCFNMSIATHQVVETKEETWSVERSDDWIAATCEQSFGKGAVWKFGRCVCTAEGTEQGTCTAPAIGAGRYGRPRAIGQVAFAQTRTRAKAGPRRDEYVAASAFIKQMDEADAQCRKLHGKHYVSDAKGGCKCVPGYTTSLSQTSEECVQGTSKACKQAFGEGVEFDGANMCRCRLGFVLAQGECVKGSDATCALLLGKHATFDGVRSCRCARGYVDAQDESLSCEKGSDAVCQQRHGSLAEFDGLYECTCKKGSIAANSTCVSGSDRLCESMLSAGAVFDGVHSCICKPGLVNTGDKCVKADDDSLCQRLNGPASYYDRRQNDCKCDKGHVLGRGGKCVAASSKVCQQQMGKNSEFDPVENQCRCMRGYSSFDLEGLEGWCTEATDKRCAQVHGDGVVFTGGNTCNCAHGYIYLKVRRLAEQVCSLFCGTSKLKCSTCCWCSHVDLCVPLCPH